MKRLLIILLLGLIILPIINAEQQTLGTFKKGDTINLIQSCDNSTYSNITRVIYPDSSFALKGNYSMDVDGNDYNYSFSLTNDLGQYLVYGFCDEDGIKTNWQYDFIITGQGKADASGGVKIAFSIAFLFLIISFLYLTINSIPHVIKLDYDLSDLLFSGSWYFGLLSIYFLEQQFLGNPGIENILEFVMNIAVYTNVIFPFIAFLLSFFLGELSYKKRVKKEKKRRRRR